METAYIICAVLGGTLLLCQFLLTLLGIGDGHDVDHGDVGGHDADAGHDVDHGGDPGHEAMALFVSMLSFRTLMAALTFFGIVGIIGCRQEWDPVFTFGSALFAGALALFLVAWLMKGLYSLKSDGTVRIERSVGTPATVYLSIPANKAGVGKIQVPVQGRTMEYLAVTAGEALPTGSKVVVVSVVSSDTVEVAPATAPVETTTHAQ